VAGITLPLTLPGIILSFARNMGEFALTIAVGSDIPGGTQTLLGDLRLDPVPGGDAGILRLMLILIAISMLALLAAKLLARRISRILLAT
jgi:molybdate transport system permease protein